MNPTGHATAPLTASAPDSTRGNAQFPVPAAALRPWPSSLRILGRRLDAWLRPQGQIPVGEDVRLRQERVLRRIVRRNRYSTFGLQHGFGTLTGYGDYAGRLPVMDDAALLHWLRYRAEQDPRALTRAPRSWREAAALPLVSGEAAPAQARAELDRLRYLSPDAFTGGVLVTAHPEAMEWSTARRALRHALVLPECLWQIGDTTLRELLMLRLALAAPDLTCLAGLDAVGLQRWTHILETHHRHLLKDLRQGGFFLADQLPAALLAKLAPALGARPELARTLSCRRRADMRLLPRDLWPRLALWVAPPAPALESLARDTLPAGARIVERHFETDPLRRAVAEPAPGGACLPKADSHFYEFAPRRAWDAGDTATLTLADLARGEDYYLIISGELGLYRYFTGDVLTVSGWYQDLPLFRFLSAAPALRAACDPARSVTRARPDSVALELAA